MDFLNINTTELQKNNLQVEEVESWGECSFDHVAHVVTFDYKKAFKNETHPGLNLGCYKVKPQLSELGYMADFVCTNENGFSAKFWIEELNQYAPDANLDWDNFTKIPAIYAAGEFDKYFEIVGHWNDDDDEWVGCKYFDCDVIVANGINEDSIEVTYLPRIFHMYKKDEGYWIYAHSDKSWVRLDNTSEAKRMSFFDEADLAAYEANNKIAKQELFRIPGFYSSDSNYRYVDFVIGENIPKGYASHKLTTLRYYNDDPLSNNLEVISDIGKGRSFLDNNILTFDYDGSVEGLIVSAIGITNVDSTWPSIYELTVPAESDCDWYVEILPTSNVFNDAVLSTNKVYSTIEDDTALAAYLEEGVWGQRVQYYSYFRSKFCQPTLSEHMNREPRGLTHCFTSPIIKAGSASSIMGYKSLFDVYCIPGVEHDSIEFKIIEVDSTGKAIGGEANANVYEIVFTKVITGYYDYEYKLIHKAVNNFSHADFAFGQRFGFNQKSIAILFRPWHGEANADRYFRIVITKPSTSGAFTIQNLHCADKASFIQDSGCSGFFTVVGGTIKTCVQNFTTEADWVGTTDRLSPEYGAWYKICDIASKDAGTLIIKTTNLSDSISNNTFTEVDKISMSSFSTSTYEVYIPKCGIKRYSNVKARKIGDEYDSALGRNGVFLLMPYGGESDEDTQIWGLYYVNVPTGIIPDTYELPPKKMRVEVSNNGEDYLYFYDIHNHVEYDGTTPLPLTQMNVAFIGPNETAMFFNAQAGIPAPFINSAVVHGDYVDLRQYRNAKTVGSDSLISTINVNDPLIFYPLVEAGVTAGINSVLRYRVPNTYGPAFGMQGDDNAATGFVEVEAYKKVIVEHAYEHCADWSVNTGYVEYVRSATVDDYGYAIGAVGIASLETWTEWVPVSNSVTMDKDNVIDDAGVYLVGGHSNLWETGRIIYAYDGPTLYTRNITFKDENGTTNDFGPNWGINARVYVKGNDGWFLEAAGTDATIAMNYKLTKDSEVITFTEKEMALYIYFHDTSVIPDHSIIVSKEYIGSSSDYLQLGYLRVPDKNNDETRLLRPTERYSHLVALSIMPASVNKIPIWIDRYNDGPSAIYLAGHNNKGEPIQIWPSIGDSFTGNTWTGNGTMGLVPAPKAGELDTTLVSNGLWMDPQASSTSANGYSFVPDIGDTYDFSALIGRYLITYLKELEADPNDSAKRCGVFAFPCFIKEDKISDSQIWGGCTCEYVIDSYMHRLRAHWTFIETATNIKLERESYIEYSSYIDVFDTDHEGVRNYNNWTWTPWIQAGFGSSIGDMSRKTYSVCNATPSDSYSFEDMANRFIIPLFNNLGRFVDGDFTSETLVFPAQIGFGEFMEFITGTMTVHLRFHVNTLWAHWTFVCNDSEANKHNWFEPVTYECESYITASKNKAVYSDWEWGPWIQSTGREHEKIKALGNYSFDSTITTVTTDKLLGRFLTDINIPVITAVSYNDLAPYFPITIRTFNNNCSDRATLELPTSFTLGSSNAVRTHGTLEYDFQEPDKPFAVCSLGYTLGVCYNPTLKRIEIELFARCPVKAHDRYWSSVWYFDGHTANGKVLTPIAPTSKLYDGTFDSYLNIKNYKNYLTLASVYNEGDCSLWHYGTGGELYDYGSANGSVTTIAPSMNLREGAFNYLRRDRYYRTEAQNEQTSLSSTQGQKLFTLFKWGTLSGDYKKYYVKLRLKPYTFQTFPSSAPFRCDAMDVIIHFRVISGGFFSDVSVTYLKDGSDPAIVPGTDTCTFILDDITSGNVDGKAWWGGSMLVRANRKFIVEVIDATPGLNCICGSWKPSIFNLTDVAMSVTSNSWVEIGGGGSNGVKIERLTQAQYDALATKDPNTIYVIS